MNAVVLDTTVASMMLNQNPLLALYYVHLLNASWLISFQTVAEMRFGALKANWGTARQQQLEVFLQRFQIIPYTDPLATHWAEVRLDAEPLAFGWKPVTLGSRPLRGY